MHPVAILACVVTVLNWGAAGLFDKVGIKGVDAYSAVLVRMVFGTAAIAVVCLLTGRVRPALEFEPRTYWCLLGSAIVGGLIGQVAYFIAMKTAPASLVVPITATYPVVAVALAILVLKEQPTIGKAIGVVLIVAGLALVSAKKDEPEGDGAVAVTASAHDMVDAGGEGAGDSAAHEE